MANKPTYEELEQRVRELEKEAIARKRAEEEKERARAYLESSLASIPDGVVLLDKEGKFAYVNPAFLKLHGREAKDFIGKTFLEISPPLMSSGMTKTIADRVKKRMETSEPVSGVEIKVIDKDNKLTPVSYSAAGIRDEKGNVIGEVCFIRDITDRKLAEEALRKRTHDLDERVKELNCLYGISYLREKRDISWEEILQGVVDLLLPSWQYPDITCSRIILEGEEYITENFKETNWRQASDIIVHGEPIGSVEVCYLEEKPESDEGPFLKEERSLINAIAERLGGIIERKRAEEALQKARDELEQRVQDRTTELSKSNVLLEQEIIEHKRTQEALRKSEAELRRLSSHLLKAQEEERKRIACELHDGIGQSLSAIKFKVETALNEMGQEDPAKVVKSLKSVVPVAQGAVEEVRRISRNLRPSILDDLGILATISWFCREVETIYSGLRIEKHIDIQEHDMPDSLKIVIYRVLQESFNNITKHSQATLVHLSLRAMDGKVELAIDDDGVGFDVEQVLSGEQSKRGIGLAGMKERAELLGGFFSVESHKGVGTTVRASWPCD